MSRSHSSLYSAVALLAAHGREIAPGSPARHRRSDAAVRAATELAAELNDLGGVHAVVIHREPNGPCTWCQLAGHEATVTVYGDPDPHMPYENPLLAEETCTTCVRKAVDQARIEHNPQSRKDIVVEIGVSPR